jgi:hypothetical protein
MKYIFLSTIVGLTLSLAACGAKSTGSSPSISSQTTVTSDSSTSGNGSSTGSIGNVGGSSSGSGNGGSAGGNGGGVGGSGDGANGLPSPPSWATVFSNIEDRAGWESCNAATCAGGSGQGTYWMAQGQSSPSRDGSSIEFYNSGLWADALWWQKLGAYDGVSNFLWDFYIYLDDSSQDAAQALEFDAFQFVNGYNYMIGSQCNYGVGVWDTWDEASGHWLHTPFSCPKFTPNSWHHIQWYMTTNQRAHQYTQLTLVVDGIVNSVNFTGNARYLGWGDNLGVQWQLDVDASGQGYHEWVDQATLTIW